jgi:hypothetical protein
MLYHAFASNDTETHRFSYDDSCLHAIGSPGAADRARQKTIILQGGFDSFIDLKSESAGPASASTVVTCWIKYKKRIFWVDRTI